MQNVPIFYPCFQFWQKEISVELMYCLNIGEDIIESFSRNTSLSTTFSVQAMIKDLMDTRKKSFWF